MFEFTDIRPRNDVQETEYQRLLGFPRQHRLEGRARELAEAARAWYEANGRPWIYAHRAASLELHDDRVVIEGTSFGSKQLYDQFVTAEATQAVLVAVSAGPECEARARELWLEEKPDEYFFLEVFGSAVVEHLINVTNGHICGWADKQGLAALPHYSPGYSGWDVSDQNNLWSLVRAASGANLPGDLSVLETGMLRPKKSLLAIIGLTANVDRARHFARLVPCENCALIGCSFRRVPYRLSLPQIEDIRQLQRSPAEGSNGSPVGSPLTPDAKYSVNPRALRKWSNERLELTTQPDGSVVARFRYEGTTCTNQGLPLEFVYRVRLSPPHEGYRITEADCSPAPADIGHTRQCEYLNDAVSLMGSIANEKPLLGEPLNAILSWDRPVNPAGCYCDLERRNHKWGLVYEVIHYALVRNVTRPVGGEIPRNPRPVAAR
jgi:hypothetical protein